MGKSTKLKRVLLLLAFLMLLPSLVPSVWGGVQKMEAGEDGAQTMQKITEEELRAIEGHYAVNVPNHQGYWVAVGFTVLMGVAAFLAWTRRR